MDGCGAGAAPDAPNFGDFDDPSTIRHVWEAADGLLLPNLARCGFLAACKVPEAPVEAWNDVRFSWGRLKPLSKGGKDSVTGHWEMAGIVLDRPFPTYPEGFPNELIKAFEAAIGRRTLGNKPASGTEIIKELGAEHLATGYPIVYTSADSVFQVACHESLFPPEELYAICLKARNLLVAPADVERVIARPFVGGRDTGFTRTGNRRDFPLSPPQNLCDDIGDVFGIGVVPELFGGRGFRKVRRTQSNAEHAEMLKSAMQSDASFIWANFEDFDMLYGHRNDPAGFGRALEQFDLFLGELLGLLRSQDLLLITADHGNDPTSASTDHSREYVPIVMAGRTGRSGPLGDVDGVAAVGATIARYLGIPPRVGTQLL
jgi:phosphopentomutase